MTFRLLSDFWRNSWKMFLWASVWPQDIVDLWCAFFGNTFQDNRDDDWFKIILDSRGNYFKGNLLGRLSVKIWWIRLFKEINKNPIIQPFGDISLIENYFLKLLFKSLPPTLHKATPVSKRSIKLSTLINSSGYNVLSHSAKSSRIAYKYSSLDLNGR